MIRRFLQRSPWHPLCYCHICGICTHKAVVRFPERFLNSCNNCLYCPNASRVLVGPFYPLSISYLFRYVVAGMMHYVASRIQPMDESLTQGRRDIGPE